MAKNNLLKRKKLIITSLVQVIIFSLFSLIGNKTFANVGLIQSQTNIPFLDTIPVEEQNIFDKVGKLPKFVGCKSCDISDLFQYLYLNIKYPEEAVSQNIEGTVVVEFVVRQDGYVSNIKILKDVKGNCGNEVLRVIESMNDNGASWVAGKMEQKTVDVRMILPVKFSGREVNRFGDDPTNGPPFRDKNVLERVSIVNNNIVYEEIFRLVEDMPRFIGCEEIKDKSQRKSCAQEKLQDFIEANMEYPVFDKKGTLDDDTVVRFLVRPDGSIKNVAIVAHSTSKEMDNAVLAMMKKMQTGAIKWIPGKQRGRKVSVQLMLRVKPKS